MTQNKKREKLAKIIGSLCQPVTVVFSFEGRHGGERNRVKDHIRSKAWQRLKKRLESTCQTPDGDGGAGAAAPTEHGSVVRCARVRHAAAASVPCAA